MINSYDNTVQTVTVNSLLNFSNNKIITGCTVTHTENSTNFNLNKPGYYFVSFNGSGATSATAGEITAQLLLNGEEVPGAVASSYSGATTENVDLGFCSIVKVYPSCCCVDNSAVLTVQNSGVGATFSNLNIVITKLC